MILRFLIILAALFLFHGCKFASNGNQPLKNEIVMTEGMKITATNRIGTIKIEAGKGFERFYTWEGGTRSAVLWPRKERWGGKFGIYYPGVGNHWKEHNRITRAGLEEAQVHFYSLDEAITFLEDSSRKDYTVYSDDGLVVTWRKAIKPTPGLGSKLIVNVWQILINGEKPHDLAGSQNDKIVVTGN